MKLATTLAAPSRAIATREHTLAERAERMCSAAFLGHLVVWREALQAQGGSGAVPESYLAAMRQVIAAEAANGAMDFEDAVAAAIAVAEQPGSGALQAAKWLLQDLDALGSEVARLIGAALGLRAGSGRAAQAQARFNLMGLVSSDCAELRATAQCLLGDMHLVEATHVAAPAEALAYRFYAAAAAEPCAAAALAHYRLGCWFQQLGTQEARERAAHHFEAGADHGCNLCLLALADVREDTDEGFAAELRELVELSDAAAQPRRRLAAEHAIPSGRRASSLRSPRKRFLDSFKGLLQPAPA